MVEHLARAAYDSMGSEDKPKNVLVEALRDYCAEHAEKKSGGDDERSTVLKILVGIVSNAHFQFYVVFVAIPALFIWRHNFTNAEKLHHDNCRLAKALFHAIFPFRNYHTVGDVIAPYLVSFLYVLSTVVGLLCVVDGIRDIINWQDYITPVFSSIVFGLSYFGGQALNSWLEKIGISSSFTFHEGDLIDIGEDIRGLVVNIDASYVQLEVETPEGGKVHKYVPPKLIADRIVTIIKKNKKRKDNMHGEEEVISDLRESVFDHYVADLIRFAAAVAKETYDQAIVNASDYLAETTETLSRWITSFWTGVSSRVCVMVTAFRWAYSRLQVPVSLPLSLSLAKPSSDSADSAIPSPAGGRGAKSPTTTAASHVSAAAASVKAPAAAASSRSRSRTPTPRNQAACPGPAPVENGSSPPTPRRSGRPASTPR